jgi:MFS family permease
LGGAVEGPERGGTIRSAFRHRDFRYLVAGQTISQTGDWLYGVALIVYVLERTGGSGAWVAATSFVRLLPFVLLGPIGGAIADRYDRKRVMILADFARAATMVVLAVAAGAHAPAWVAIALASISVTFAVPYFPAVNAATPALVGEEDLTAANSITATIANLTLALGPAVGGVLLAIGSPAVAFAVNGATFLGSAALTAPIRTRLSTAAQEDATAEKSPSLGKRLTEGFRAISSSADVVLLVVVSIAFTIFYGQEIVLYALAAIERLGLGEAGIGYMFAATGVGGILAVGLTKRASNRSRQGAILVLSAVAAGIPMIALAFVRSPAVAFALLLVEGVGFILGDVVATTMLQRILPGEVLGRVLGILDSLMVAGILAGSVIAPLVLRAGGLQVALIVGGAMLVGAGLVLLPRARAIDRRTAERVAELEPRVELLERLGIFEAANRQTLEALAAALKVETVGPATVVVREGDEPDDLFVVVSGSLEVTSHGEAHEKRRVAVLRPGDYFGEIGLLEKIPRTATVTALTECDLYRIAGEDFLRIVTEGSKVSENLRAGVAARLARTYATEELGHA